MALGFWYVTAFYLTEEWLNNGAGSYIFKQSSISPIRSEYKITNVVASDFNYDGRLDVLVMSQSSPGSWFDDRTTHMSLYLGKEGHAFSDPIVLPSATIQQPMILDASGDMRMSLLGFAKDQPDEIALWRNSGNVSSIFELSVRFLTAYHIADCFMSSSTSPLTSPLRCKWPNPHSNAFIDLDGDCLAGMVLFSALALCH